MCHRGSVPEKRGGVSIRGLWESQTEAIIGFRFGDADADTWNPEGMDKLLDRWGKSRRKNTRRLAMTNRELFLFVLSVDGMMEKEAQVVLATLSGLMAAKMDESISYVKDQVNSQIEIAFTRL